MRRVLQVSALPYQLMGLMMPMFVAVIDEQRHQQGVELPLTEGDRTGEDTDDTAQSERYRGEHLFPGNILVCINLP